ncbi:MAG: hypothetical protein Q8Q10_01500 [bacterium]|nr:hypothetical protein [bacterium]
MRKTNFILLILLGGGLVLFVAFFTSPRDSYTNFNAPSVAQETNKTLKKDPVDISKNSGIQCLNKETSKDEIKQIMAKEGLDISDVSEETLQQYVDLPRCEDICKKQLEYSKEYPDEWFADEDLRKICSNLGIKLPL